MLVEMNDDRMQRKVQRHVNRQPTRHSKNGEQCQHC